MGYPGVAPGDRRVGRGHRGDRVPGAATVGGDLDAGDHTAARVSGGPGDRHGRTVRQGGALGRRGDRRGGRRRVGRRRGRRKPLHQRGRLRAHVGEQVHRCLLHGGIGRGQARHCRPRSPLSRPHDHCTVPAPNTRAPLAARYKVRWWVAVCVVFRRASVVGEDLRDWCRWSMTCPSARGAGTRCRHPRPTRSPGRWSLAASVVESPGDRPATRVFRQNRSLLY